jgi:alpha-D-glucose phosphate-specific phosphoglucomutase
MIKFGTSGWRAVLAEEFTFDNARRVVAAIARVARKHGDAGRGILVASDTRFLGERFMDEAARVLHREGVRALVCDRDAPTPVVAYTIRALGTLGGINFTASHNPPEYNGIKFSTADGAPALPELTSQIEAELAKTTDADAAPAPTSDAKAERVDPREPYLTRLKELVSGDVLSRAGLKVAVDPRFGTSRGYLDEFLRRSGVDVALINGHRDPYFGGLSPQCDEKNLGALAERVVKDGRKLGLATDGDADRFGVLDADGHYINPNLCLMLLAESLLARGAGGKRGVARSVATTSGLDAVAATHGVAVHETPVGFKYIGDLLLKDQIVMGGEESAGFTMVGHVPEKDGILADLLVAELVAKSGKTLGALVDELFAKVGPVVPLRFDARLDPHRAAALEARLAQDPSTFAGLKVEKIDRMDGQKLMLGDARWILFRPSGTEPVVRIYAESRSKEESDRLLEAARRYVLEE